MVNWAIGIRGVNRSWECTVFGPTAGEISSPVGNRGVNALSKISTPKNSPSKKSGSAKEENSGLPMELTQTGVRTPSEKVSASTTDGGSIDSPKISEVPSHKESGNSKSRGRKGFELEEWISWMDGLRAMDLREEA